MTGHNEIATSISQSKIALRNYEQGHHVEKSLEIK